MIRCTSEAERVEKLLTVNKRLKDIDTGDYEYELCCPSLTGHYQYHQEDVDDLFVDTGLTNADGKPITDDEIRSLYQSMHEHSWTETVSRTLLCLHCKLHIPYPDDDECPECGDSERTGLGEVESESAPLVCIRHGVLTEVDAVAE